MEIRWLGQSCFRIKGKYTTIITDPFSPDTGYSLGKQKADIVTVSHQHSDHNNIAGIDGSPKQVTGPGEYEIIGGNEIDSVIILGLATFHDKDKGGKLGKNTVFLMEIDELSICHLGDLGHILTEEQVEELGDIDVLMIPVGGQTTIDAQAAAELVRKLEPKAVIPMHYGTDVATMELDPVDKFLKEIGVNGIEPQPKLLLSKSNLPQSTQVILLQY